MQRIIILLSGLVLAATSAFAQNRRSPQHIRAAVAQKLGAQRAATLQPVIEREAVAVLSSPLTTTSEAGGFALISYSANTPVVLAYGDQPFDPANPSPEFLYLLDVYEQAVEAAERGDEAAPFAAEAESNPADDLGTPENDETWPNVSPMLTTTWAQGSPYYDQCPIFYNTSSRCVTGCVATAMAQVLNYYKMPKAMHGQKTYGYYVQKNDGTNVRVDYSFDFGATTFDWANMKNHYGNSDTQAQKNAVAELMYACGVATSMHYSPNESYANTWVGTDAINCFMDGLRAEHAEFTTDRVISELQAGHPVIYSGSREGGGAHCFVIDGCKSDGTLHLNLGWGGSNDGYYLPTNMANYSKSMGIECVWPSDYVPTYTPIHELAGKFATASTTPATTIEAGKWYALWNAGRAGSPISNGLGATITNTSLLPDGHPTDLCANQLIRLVSREAGGYYIQTGLGDYFNRFYTYNSSGTTSSPIGYFYLSSIEPGYFAINSNSTCYLDTNGPGGTVVGWSTTKPTDKYSNSSWIFYPVELTDTDPSAGLGIGSGAVFDNNKYYTLKNTGYSQGYLVAIGEDDAHPTLRGVTQDHKENGLLAGALYHDAPDIYNHGYYWQILTEGNKQYLVNYGTGKYLANEGNQTKYVFTDQKTPINIVRMADGTFRFNSSTEEKSFLCAATHLENPAAFWTYDDLGSIWQVEETEVKRPYVGVQTLLLSHSSAILFSGQTQSLTVTVLPTNATDASVNWSSSNTAVATVNASGLVTAVAKGEAIITATSVDNAEVTASFSVQVIGKQQQSGLTSLTEDKIFLLRNLSTGTYAYSRGYLVALSDDDEHPTLRGVEVAHPTHGCCDDAYKDAPDFFSPYSYWQIFTDGSDRYLYNIGVGKFLTNEGDRTAYIFTDNPTPINVSLASVGTFRFNVGTETYSYLCAATHLVNPAAYWNSTDTGTYWSVEAVDGLGIEPVDFFVAFGDMSIGNVTEVVGRLTNGDATLSELDRVRKLVLRTKPNQ